MAPSPPRFSKVLLIRPGALGDTLMLAPALKSLEKRHFMMVAGKMPGLDAIAPLTHRRFDMELPPWNRLFIPSSISATLVVPPPDLIVCFLSDTEGLVKSNLQAWYPKARVCFFPSLPRPGKKVHASLHISRCLRASGLSLDPDMIHQDAMRLPVLGPSGKGRVTPHKGYIILHPGSGSRKKNIPFYLWKKLFLEIRTIVPESLRPIFLLGPAELDILEEIKEAKLKAQTLISTSIEDLACYLKRAALFVGHDSGPTHMAAMIGIPTVSLFKATDPVVWHPLGPSVKVLEGTDDELMDGVISHVKDFFSQGPFAVN